MGNGAEAEQAPRSASEVVLSREGRSSTAPDNDRWTVEKEEGGKEKPRPKKTSRRRHVTLEAGIWTRCSSATHNPDQTEVVFPSRSATMDNMRAPPGGWPTENTLSFISHAVFVLSEEQLSF